MNHPSTSNSGWNANMTVEKLELNLWSVLGSFNPNASVQKTYDTTKKIMDFFKKYCQIVAKKSKPKKPKNASKSSGTKESSSTAKSSSAAKAIKDKKSSKTASKPANVSKMSDSLESLFEFGAQDDFDAYDDTEYEATASNLLAVTTPKPASVTATTGTKDHAVLVPAQKPTKLERELKRLATSDDFVAMYASSYKRVPKPIQRFEVAQYEEERLRRSSRATSRRTSRAPSRAPSRAHSRPTSRATSRASTRPTSRASSRSSCRIVDPCEEMDVSDGTVYQTILKKTSTIGSYYMEKRNTVNYYKWISNESLFLC